MTFVNVCGRFFADDPEYSEVLGFLGLRGDGRRRSPLGFGGVADQNKGVTLLDPRRNPSQTFIDSFNRFQGY